MTWGANKPANKDGLTVEDGFIRSMGLSPDQYFPFSLAVDSLGIHYDPKHTSELEEMLKNRDKLSPLIERAKKLRKLIVEHGVTKYNLSEKTWQRPEGNKNVILVIGQVPSDASIKLGAIDIKTDSELIKIIRLSQPDAYMVYKPHPDVEEVLVDEERLARAEDPQADNEDGEGAGPGAPARVGAPPGHGDRVGGPQEGQALAHPRSLAYVVAGAPRGGRLGPRRTAGGARPP
jgi:capsular polysaccharide export protein